MSIILALIPVAIQLVGWFLKLAGAKEETLKKFYEFAKIAGEDMGSTKLMKYGDQQLEWLKTHPWKPGAN